MALLKEQSNSERVSALAYNIMSNVIGS